MPRAPSIATCNIALSKVRAPIIVSLDDDQPEARACAVHYDHCLQLLLEAHEWGFATVRSRLALLDTNDRTGEWLYSYALPGDISSSAAVICTFQTPLSGVYYPWPYDWPRPPFSLSNFIISGDTVYTNREGAVLQYVSRDVSEDKLPAMFKDALALRLAAELSIALLDDRAKKGDFIKEYEVAKQRAVAEDLNRYPRRDDPVMDELAWVRA